MMQVEQARRSEKELAQELEPVAASRSVSLEAE